MYYLLIIHYLLYCFIAEGAELEPSEREARTTSTTSTTLATAAEAYLNDPLQVVAPDIDARTEIRIYGK